MNLICVSRVLSLLSMFLLMTSSSALSQHGPQTLYFKNGKQVNCDQVWQEGDNLFVVPQGKRFAISYEKNEIDLQRSSVQIPVKTISPPAAQATTDVVVIPPSGERSRLRIYHHEYSLAPKSYPPQTKEKTSEEPSSPTPAANARNATERRDFGGSAPADTPVSYGVANNPGYTGMAEPKRIPDNQMQREANRNKQEEYQKKLREYEAAKSKNEQEYQQKLNEYEAAKRQAEEQNRQVKKYNAQVRKDNAAVKRQMENEGQNPGYYYEPILPDPHSSFTGVRITPNINSKPTRRNEGPRQGK